MSKWRLPATLRKATLGRTRAREVRRRPDYQVSSLEERIMAQRSVRVLALRHIMCEYLGGFERYFKESGAQVTYIDTATAGELPPNHHGYDLLAILGGPMSVNDTDAW